MKKCKGCGVELQSTYNNKAGFVINNNQEYCQRCFRLIHYGDTSQLLINSFDNNAVFDIYRKYRNDLFAVVVDSFDGLCLDKDSLLENFKNYDVLLVINKIDLLPKSVKDDKLEDVYRKVLSKIDNHNIVSCLLTYNNDYTFNSLFFETLKTLNYKKIVMAGRVNAGKTTIINKLLKSNDLTVSPYPGTTVNENSIAINDYEFIDTPGLVDTHSFIYHIEYRLLNLLVPNKTVKPRIFQLYEEQSYFVDGLLRIDYKPIENASISFYIKNEIDVHRCKTIKADEYLKKHLDSLILILWPFDTINLKNIKDKCLYIKGLGFIRFKGQGDVKISINKQIDVLSTEVNI